MIKELLYKVFGLEPTACPVCEVLREQLIKADNERKELLTRALAPPIQVVEEKPSEPPVPITPQFIPWRVRQQMMEAEDRKKSSLMREKAKEIEELEKKLGVTK